ncbi:MAG: hypothetical protein PHI66_04005 [Candidatus Pacebacteria bacterium]|nr:hypothetical protein [Candidatus Paceibacterota bacterium]
MQKEPLSLSMVKIVIRVSLIVGVALVFGITGYLAINKDNLGGLSKSDIEENDNSAIDETATWEIYANEEYGFEMKYPNGWFLYEGGDNVYFQPDEEVKGNIPGPHASALSVKIEKFSEDGNLEQKIKTDKNRAGIEFEQSKIMIGGEDAFLVKSICEGVGCGSPEWYFVKDEYLYNFNSNLGYSPVFDRVISTFKFIEREKSASCSKEGDLSVLENSAYPSSKARITSKEGNQGGRSSFPNRSFVIDDSDFILEGVNVPEVNKITVEWDGDKKAMQVENFERGDTHWCFEISEAKGNLAKGVNIYIVRLDLDEDEAIEYSVRLTQNVFKSEIEDEEVLHINWLSEIEEASVEKFFSQQQRDNFYTDCNYYESDYRTEKPCYDLFSFYKAGTVSDGKYKGYDYYLISMTVMGHGESDYYYRMIFSPTDKRMILMAEYSNGLEARDKEYFTLAKNITIDNLLPKAEIPIPNTKYFLEAHSESPNILFSDIAEGYYSSTCSKIFTDNDAGDVYLEENKKAFFIRVSDGSLMVYRIKLPFASAREESSDWNADDLLLDIQFMDGKQNTEYYLHGSRYQFVCAGGALYDIVSDNFLNIDTQLRLAGTSSSGDKFYEISDEAKMKAIYDNKSTIPYGGISGSTSYIFSQDMTFEEFQDLHPLLFWKDPFGRWIQFTNNIFSSAAECGGGFGKSAL